MIAQGSPGYRQRLGTQRYVRLEGRDVEDVREPAALQGAIRVIEGFYRLHDERPDVHVTHVDGVKASIGLLIPRNRTDLRRKERHFEEVAALSSGLLGRTPDFMNAALAAIAGHANVLGEGTHTSFQDNAVSYHQHVCRLGLFVCHGAINPHIDRGVPIGLQERGAPGVKVMSQSQHGIIVSGAKMIVTLAPIADEILFFNMPGLQEPDQDYAVAFALPVSCPGLRIFCRKTHHHDSGRSTFDHPLSNMFDEVDAYVTLDEVFVPWERVLLCRDVAASNAFYDQTRARAHAGHQAVIRGQRKAVFALGLAYELAEKLGLIGRPDIQEELGRLGARLDLFSAAIAAVEERSQLDEHGVCNPDIRFIQSIRINFPGYYGAILDIIQKMGGGSILSVPHSRDFEGEMGLDLDRVMTGRSASAITRSHLLNAAWDLTGEAFGQRQKVYEFFHSGDPARLAINYFKDHERNGERAVARNGIQA